MCLVGFVVLCLGDFSEPMLERVLISSILAPCKSSKIVACICTYALSGACTLHEPYAIPSQEVDCIPEKTLLLRTKPAPIAGCTVPAPGQCFGLLMFFAARYGTAEIVLASGRRPPGYSVNARAKGSPGWREYEARLGLDGTSPAASN